MADIRIDASELADPAVEEIVNLQKSLARSSGQFVEDIRTPLYLNPIFYYAAAAMVTALLVWYACEPLVRDVELHYVNAGRRLELNDIGYMVLVNYTFFCGTAVLIGVAMAVAYGLSNRNWRQMFYCVAVSMGVGLLAALISATVGSVLYGIGGVAVRVAVQNFGGWTPGEKHLHGLPFFLQMCTRAMSWAAVAAGAGVGLGVALKSPKLVLNGVAGGLLGGMLGGLLFDPVARFLTAEDAGGWISRMVGVGSIGLLVGLFTGLFENMSKDAWFLMLKGPLAGKQFIVFRSPLVIGSAPKSDIYLFKDPAIEPRHATVTKSGAKYVLQDTGTPAGTFVNGRKVDRCILQSDDVVSIGETVLKYHERVKR